MTFAQSAMRLIHRHGLRSTYTSVTTGTYNIETGGVTNISSNFSIVMYMKHVKTSQFNYPNLIGKEVGLFYVVAADLNILPKTQDTITYNSKTYTVHSFQSHAALGSVVLYRIIAVE